MALDPNKIALCWPNYIDDAVVSGGAWVPTLPLEHIQDDRTSVVAKTASLDPADTQFSITLPKRERLQVLAIYAHNLSARATIRVRVYRDAGQTDLIDDTGWQNVWPVLYGLDGVIWGNDNFWNRRLSEDDRTKYTPLTPVLFEERLLGTSLHVELLDTSNPDGAIMLGRVMPADVWQPIKNLDWNVSHPNHPSGRPQAHRLRPPRHAEAYRAIPAIKPHGRRGISTPSQAATHTGHSGRDPLPLVTETIPDQLCAGNDCTANRTQRHHTPVSR